MSNTRIIKPKSLVRDSFLRSLTNISIDEAGWVDDTSVSGFWYYDYSNTIIENHMDVKVIVDSAESNVDIVSSISSNGYVRIYSRSQQITFNCDIFLIGGEAN